MLRYLEIHCHQCCCRLKKSQCRAQDIASDWSKQTRHDPTRPPFLTRAEVSSFWVNIFRLDGMRNETVPHVSGMLQMSGGRVTHNVSRHRVRAWVQQARCQVDASHTMCQDIESAHGVNKPGVRWTCHSQCVKT
ncbi:hypothetical protein RRG08_065113 [Elysia crispata]|uniref:Uncharacterized protein n=1 Tax=Elysia crispata TaxID=231223 RepID=A0AAE0ZBF3_9GAST|nr:hypothetical protein RRG08_065113 [Elysia crispata]